MFEGFSLVCCCHCLLFAAVIYGTCIISITLLKSFVCDHLEVSGITSILCSNSYFVLCL